MQDIAAGGAGVVMVGVTIGMAHIFCRSKRRGWQTVLAWMLWILSFLAMGLLRSGDGGCSGRFTGLLSVFVYLYLFDVPVCHRIFTCFFVETFKYFTAVFSGYTVLWVHGFCPGFNPYTVFMLVCVLLTAAGMFFFFRYLRISMVERLGWLAQSGNLLRSLAVFAGSGYAVMACLFDVWPVRDPVMTGEYLTLLLYGVLLACGYNIAFFNMKAAEESALDQDRIQELTAQVQQSEQYDLTLAGHIQEVRRIQHDSRHHLRVLSGYARAGAYDMLQDYLSALIGQVPDTSSLFYCSHYAANILLGYYSEQAKDAGIVFRCDAQIPDNLPCAPTDICTVLGNALQNALEACGRQEAGVDRYISLLARIVRDNLTLEIKNSYDGVMLEQDGRFITRKEESGHGLGLTSIRRIAKQYHGYCSVTRTEQEFTLRVIIPPGA